MEFRMNKLLAGGAAVAVVTALAVSNLWLAAADMVPPARVHFQGCVKPGVEAGCLIVEDDGKIYNVTSANDRLAVGTYASGTGVPGGASICMQGVALRDIVLDKTQPPHEDCAKGPKVTTAH
jgi:hypothetical protein